MVERSEPALTLGQTVERYTVEARIGRGGVAHVYRVRHTSLGSVHALKSLRVQGPTLANRLVQEGKVQAALRHVNVVAVTDIVDIMGRPGLVMDYVDGPTLSGWLRKNRPSLAEAEAIFRGILAGVACAHRLGLVHRDLKPANVLLATDENGALIPKVADFGLAKILVGDDEEMHEHGYTHAGTTMGTPGYMAPEQVGDANAVDQRADIFALGCILYELCTGSAPFYRRDLLEVFSALASGIYSAPESVVPDLPDRIADAIRGCLVVRRDDRIRSCGALLRVLDGGNGDDGASFGSFQSCVSPPSAESEGAPTVLGSTPPSLVGSRLGPRSLLTSDRVQAVGGLAFAAVGFAGFVFIVGVAAIVAGFGWSQLAAAPPPPPSTRNLPVIQQLPLQVVAFPPPDPPSVEVPLARAPARSQAPVPNAPASSATATVSATGDADEVWLEGPDGRLDLGAVPAGTYRIVASFDGQAPRSAGRATVHAGRPMTLSCSAAFQLCKAR